MDREQDNGHFTQLVNDFSYKIGCAMSRYTTNKIYNSFLVCNYAVTNIINQTIYTVGPTASQCQTGTHPNYTSLCSVNEVYSGMKFENI